MATVSSMHLREFDSLFQQGPILYSTKTSTTYLACNSLRKITLKTSRKSLHHEIQILQALKEGPNIHSIESTVTMEGENRGIVLPYYPYSLSLEIAARNKPYTERRIAHYMLQLSEALAFCHQRSIYHGNVQSSNVLVDPHTQSLVLTEFGNARTSRFDPNPFAPKAPYTPPELTSLGTSLATSRTNGYDMEKVDSFGLGSILLELIHGKLASEMLPLHASCIGQSFFLNFSRLDSQALSLLRLSPEQRQSPSEVAAWLRDDFASSPLLSEDSKTELITGAPVTIDNVRLGMFVQRGPDWISGDEDGGVGSLGVVTQLLTRGLVCVVTWAHSPQEPKECHIGQAGKYNLRVGPTQIPDIFHQTDKLLENGIIQGDEIKTGDYTVGQQLNENCVVLSIDTDKNRMFVAPLDRLSFPSVDPPSTTVYVPPVEAKPDPIPPFPAEWRSQDILSEVPLEDRIKVTNWLYDNSISARPGFSNTRHVIDTIQRVQNEDIWAPYYEFRRQIASEYWGEPSEGIVYFGTNQIPTRNVLSGSSSRLEPFRFMLYQSPLSAIEQAYKLPSGLQQIVVARAVVGRYRRNHDDCPGAHSRVIPNSHACEVHNAAQILPLYIVTFSTLLSSRRSRRLNPTWWPHGRPRRRTARTSQSQFVLFDTTPVDRAEGIPSTPGGLTHDAGSSSQSPRTSGRNSRGSQDPHGRQSSIDERLAIWNERYSEVLQRLQQSNPTESGTAQLSLESLNLNGFQRQVEPVDQNESQCASVPTELRAGNQPERALPIKQCVICLDRDVSVLLTPCGHPCLCCECSTEGNLRLLRNKCPECREKIRAIVPFFGKILDQDA